VRTSLVRAFLGLLILLLGVAGVSAETVAVRRAEGLIHGFPPPRCLLRAEE